MNNQIDRIVEDAKQLSYDELKVISERLLDILDEMEWDGMRLSPNLM